MNKSQFINELSKLGLTPREYIVLGSGSMCALGIREAHDIDLCVSPRVIAKFESSGNWQLKSFPDDPSYYLVKGIFEVGMDWASKDGKPNLEELKVDEFIVDGIPFVSLKRVRAWKLWKGTEKHLKEIQLIDDYLESI